MALSVWKAEKFGQELFKMTIKVFRTVKAMQVLIVWKSIDTYLIGIGCFVLRQIAV